MISMPQMQSIRSRRRNGESIASIARSERVSEPTVRKYLRVDDLSARPPVRRRRGSVIDEWLPVIEGMLAEDRETWRKQRHTATRIHERLRDGYGAGVSLSTVTRTVARLRREAAAEREAGFLDLSWHPGECQADFGQVDVRYRGVVTRMRHFVLDFPYSNIGPSRLMPGENAECTCQALRNLFEWLGGVPERIVYDNAAGVGRKWFDGIRLTRLFQAFQAHYGFEYTFCNPYSGHEKGGVEARVGAVRRRLFVPVPGVWNLDSFNLRLTGLDFAAKAQDLVFYGKTGRGKTHLATALGMLAVERGRSVRFRQTAELVLQLGKAKRDGALDSLLGDLARADLIILDEFGYVPFDIDGARLLYQIIAGSYERRSIIFTTNIEFSKWGTIFADDKLAAAIIDRIVHHGRLIEFTGPSRRVSQALMFGKTDNQ